jgi:hypothetical protein
VFFCAREHQEVRMSDPRFEVLAEPAELAVRRARSRVGVAAMKCKHNSSSTTCAIADDEAETAALLRAYYERQLEIGRELAAISNVGPAPAEFQKALRQLNERYKAVLPEDEHRVLIEKCIKLLDKFISRLFTNDDAAELLKVLTETSNFAVPSRLT